MHRHLGAAALDSGHHLAELDVFPQAIGQVLDQLRHPAKHPAVLETAADGEQRLQIDTTVGQIQRTGQFDLIDAMAVRGRQHAGEIRLGGRGAQIRPHPARQGLGEPGRVGRGPGEIADHAHRQPAETQDPLPQIGHLEGCQRVVALGYRLAAVDLALGADEQIALLRADQFESGGLDEVEHQMVPRADPLAPKVNHLAIMLHGFHAAPDPLTSLQHRDIQAAIHQLRRCSQTRETGPDHHTVQHASQSTEPARHALRRGRVPARSCSTAPSRDHRNRSGTPTPPLGRTGRRRRMRGLPLASPARWRARITP